MSVVFSYSTHIIQQLPCWLLPIFNFLLILLPNICDPPLRLVLESNPSQSGLFHLYFSVCFDCFELWQQHHQQESVIFQVSFYWLADLILRLFLWFHYPHKLNQVRFKSPKLDVSEASKTWIMVVGRVKVTFIFMFEACLLWVKSLMAKFVLTGPGNFLANNSTEYVML